MAKNPQRLMYSKVNQAFVFTFGDQLLRMGDHPMFFRNKADAIRAALKQGLLVDKKGYVTSVEGGAEGLEGPHGSHWALVKALGVDDNVVSTHRTKEAAENAMRKAGGEPGSLFTRGLRVVDIGPDSGNEMIVIFGKRTIRPRSGRGGVRGVDGLEGGGSKRDKLQSLDDFTNGYITAALWSTNDESDESGGEPLDSNYDASDLTHEALDKMISDSKRFQEENAELLAQAGDDGQNGHDFWLTRNGHGAGFWDRGYGDVGEKLSEAAKAYRQVYLSVSGGKIHHG